MIDILEIFAEAAQLGREKFPRSEWSRQGGGAWDVSELQKQVYYARRKIKARIAERTMPEVVKAEKRLCRAQRVARRKKLEREARAARKAELLALGWSS